MDFLKNLFGGKALTYEELVQLINAHNGDEANKGSQIKIGNLGGGEYVGKAKHDAEIERLNALLSGKDTDIQTLTATLEAMKKGKNDAEAIQAKLAEVERLLAESKTREAETKMKYALRDLLREENVTDVDYAEYLIQKKMIEEGKNIELDEGEHIKGRDDLIGGLKTQAPGIFKKAADVEIEENPLPTGKTGGMTRSDLLRKPYAERAAFAKENPEQYSEIMKSK